MYGAHIILYQLFCQVSGNVQRLGPPSRAPPALPSRRLDVYLPATFRQSPAIHNCRNPTALGIIIVVVIVILIFMIIIVMIIIVVIIMVVIIIIRSADHSSNGASK